MTTLSALSDDLLTNEEAAALLGIKPNTLEIWRGKGKGPNFIKMGPAKQDPIRYHIDEIKAWLASCTFTSTSAYAPNAKQAV
ncbi:helix-turn-helix domain-containing protein [Xylella fastidiosa subsp. multiplex]|uniref:helix-turn-helix transcriptional regulator n=1 Tax=Xylella fastidiosa TaxID=2371 RepID=UPI001892A2E3|nr:helix-turn-helix domain-containing protein [Xylella fastidiosa]QPC01725.1 helix-turn-helix domain-containing protein [Xylella fastidiosa subsp. multiplex]